MRTYVSMIVSGLAASLVLGVAPGRAADSANLDQHAQAVDRASTNAGSQNVAGRLASELNDSWGRTPGPYTAESLATQRAQTGWGWGGVLIGNRLAQHVAESRLAANPTLTPAEALAQSLAAVTAARQARTGWGVIAQENGVKVGALVSSVKQSTESVTTGRRSTDKQGAKSLDRAAARGPAPGTSERAARGAERSAKSDKARGGATTSRTASTRGTSEAVALPFPVPVSPEPLGTAARTAVAAARVVAPRPMPVEQGTGVVAVRVAAPAAVEAMVAVAAAMVAVGVMVAAGVTAAATAAAGEARASSGPPWSGSYADGRRAGCRRPSCVCTPASRGFPSGFSSPP